MDTNSTGVSTARKPKGRIRKFFLRAFLAIAVIILAAHFIWKYSGDNQWEKVAERNGVTVYAMKSPGSSVKKFKATWKVKSRLGSLVSWVNDTDKPRESRPMGLYDLRVLGRVGDRVSWTAYKQPLASFLEPREFVIKTEFSQDPKTKALIYTVEGVPDRIPPDDCCVRVAMMDNRWTLTPLRNGEVHVEWFTDMDLGGAVPYLLQNKVQPAGMLNFAPKVQKFLDRPEYKNATYSWIEEAHL